MQNLNYSIKLKLNLWNLWILIDLIYSYDFIDYKFQ